MQVYDISCFDNHQYHERFILFDLNQDRRAQFSVSFIFAHIELLHAFMKFLGSLYYIAFKTSSFD